MSKKMRILLTVVAAIVLVAVSVMGTMAYLTATSGEVKNTFIPADILVNIDEHVYNPAENELTDDITTTGNDNYQIIPGRELPKDPMVDANASVPIYVFVTVDTDDWLAGMTYTIDSSAWTELVTNAGKVYYLEVTDADDNGDYAITDIPVLVGNEIAVNSNMTEDDMKDHSPSIAFYAYAIQIEGFDDAADAWINGLGKTLPTAPTT